MSWSHPQSKPAALRWKERTPVNAMVPAILLAVPSNWGENFCSSGVLWPRADQDPGPGAPVWPHPLFRASHRQSTEHPDSFWE